MEGSVFLSVFVTLMALLQTETWAELSVEEIEKAHVVFRQHCQPTTGVSDAVLGGLMSGNFPDDRNLKCYLQCIMALSHALKNGQYRADLALRLADDVLPSSLKDRARAAVEKCRTAGDGLPDECEMAYAIKKCFFDIDPEIFHVL